MNPLACAGFLVVTFVLAGAAQTVWLRSRLSDRLALPLDLGKTFRGRRILGANKTLRGFVVMVPATALSFFAVGLLVARSEALNTMLWSLSPVGYGMLGLVAGLGFMLGELPNSFMKRQLGIPPGESPRRWPAKITTFIIDRLDSIVGMLAAVTLAVPTPWKTWLYVVLFGPAVHWSFSLVLYAIGVKERPA